MPDDADAQSPDIAGQRRPVIRDRAVGACRVLRIVAGNRLQQDRAILDRPRHRPGMIEGEGIGVDAGAADQTVSRFQADDAAQRRRAADRAAGIGAERAGDKAGGNRGPGAARRAAGEVVAVPRIARRRPGQIEGRPAMREFMGRELAQQHRAGLVKLGDGGRVFGRDEVLADFRVAGGADAGGRIDVLQPERYAVQRAAIVAGHDLALGRSRLLAGLFRRRQQKGVELRVERLDAREQRIGQFDRREPAASRSGGRHRRSSANEVRLALRSDRWARWPPRIIRRCQALGTSSCNGVPSRMR